jgi:hypothetical protein
LNSSGNTSWRYTSMTLEVRQLPQLYFAFGHCLDKEGRRFPFEFLAVKVKVVGINFIAGDVERVAAKIVPRIFLIRFGHPCLSLRWKMLETLAQQSRAEQLPVLLCSAPLPTSSFSCKASGHMAAALLGSLTNAAVCGSSAQSRLQPDRQLRFHPTSLSHRSKCA